MKEVFIYSLAAVSGLSILGFSVHMFVGGLVSAATEKILIVVICLLGALVMAFMAWDVIRRRQNR